MRWGVVVGLVVVLPLTAAGQDAVAPVRADLEFFEAKVRPVLAERCFRCHSTAAKKSKGNLLLDSRGAILKGGDSGPAAVPGQPEKSLLLRAVGYEDGDLTMPPQGKLPDHEIAALTEWVRRGLPFPGGDASTTAAKTNISLFAGRQFWSFQPVRALPAPKVQRANWIARPLDAFILAEIEKRGLSPAPAAEPRVLLRRLYFDVVGLPPTPIEMEEFVVAWQSSIAKRPALIHSTVERLLASPHYGERWGRYWLDMARYCDVAESWAEHKGQPYLYRDWVVKALNDDVPYDQFVMKQLAADLAPNAQPADRAALGFLGLSPTYWKELKLAPDVIKTVVAEEWEERIHAVTSTFLGLTVSCARCHDHKYDPITTQDYYALAGVFASTRLADRPIVPDEVAQAVAKARQQVAALETQISKLKADKTKAQTQQVATLRAEIDQLIRTTHHYDAAFVPGVEDSSLFVLPDGPHKTRLEYKPGPLTVAMQIRGSVTNLGPIVPRRFLAVLTPADSKPFSQGSGRFELARAMVTDAAPLTARVMVNRIWRHHMGRGLVETPSDFGAQGDRPSHPELLDDLAARFMQNGWSLKWLHREILMSSTYQQASHMLPSDATSSSVQAKSFTSDPENKYLSRMSRRRLDVEAWRDAMLSVTGSLDRRVGGPALDLADPKNQRRTLYGLIKRRELNDLLRLHDFPDPTVHSGNRVPTITPLQQLYTLNSPFLQQQAAALVKRLQREVSGTTDDRIRQAYVLLFGRPATDTQVRLGVEFLTPTTDAAWHQYAQVLLGSNEFLFVD